MDKQTQNVTPPTTEYRSVFKSKVIATHVTARQTLRTLRSGVSLSPEDETV